MSLRLWKENEEKKRGGISAKVGSRNMTEKLFLSDLKKKKIIILPILNNEKK